MPAIFTVPNDYPERAIGTYERESSPDRFIFREARRLDPSLPSPTIRFEVSARVLERYDCLPNSALLPLVSDRVGKLLDLECKEDIQLVPAIIVTSDGRQSRRHIVNVTRAITAVDFSESDALMFPGTNAVMKFNRLRLLNPLPVFHIARVAEYRSYILFSDEVVALLANGGFTGFSFIKPDGVHP